MSLYQTSRLLMILKTFGEIIETEIEKHFKPDFINKCDKVEIKPMDNFDATRYLGTWYETAHVKEFLFQPGDSVCIVAEYTDKGNNEFKVVNSYQEGSVQGDLTESTEWGSLSKRKSITGHATCASPDKTGACEVQFFSDFKGTPNYNVIDTDYENYTIVYDCNENSQNQIVWILSRTPVMSDATLVKVMAILAEKVPNFSPTHFDGITYQGDQCSYY